MAKGDVVVDELSAASAYQPASGVEVCITNVSNTAAGTGSLWTYYNGSIKGEFANPESSSTTLPDECAVKMFITNALYIYTAHGGSYSGVQVK